MEMKVHSYIVYIIDLNRDLWGFWNTHHRIGAEINVCAYLIVVIVVHILFRNY